jgi:hypothetical protein
MEWFVEKNSIALNKAVDWLYFTGRLPADPLGRLFSTVTYSREIIFSKTEDAYKAIDKITNIHKAVEISRGHAIPDWAYRNVLFMLIYYSIASFELLERRLTDIEKQEVFNVFYDVGLRMGLKELPANYITWLMAREQHLQSDLVKSDYSIDLLNQYKKHLGSFRYWILVQGQLMIIPPKVKELLQLGKASHFSPLLRFYKLTQKLKIDWLLKAFILPSVYKAQIKTLDVLEN